MKKLLIAFGLAALVSSSQAQGTVSFLNSSSTLVTLQAADGTNLGPIPSGAPATYMFEIFKAPPGTTTAASFTSTGLIGTNINAAGRLIGGNNLAVPGTALGGTAAFLVYGWSANLGSTYLQAFNSYNAGTPGYLGSSSIASNFLLGGDGGAGNIPTSPLFGAAAYQITSGFALVANAVPEPSSIVLAGLGAASLLMFRRRK